MLRIFELGKLVSRDIQTKSEINHNVVIYYKNLLVLYKENEENEF